MTIAPPEVKAAKATLAAHRRALRKARPAKVQPVAEGQRQPRKRDRAYLAWIRRLPCIAGLVEGGCDGPVQAAHLRMAGGGRRNPGLGAKPDDRFATPLCERHHLHDQHRGSEAAFWARLGISPHALCDTLSTVFDADGDAVALLNRIARGER